MDVTTGSHNGYNWDDISIGCGDLDQSKQFFVNFKNSYEKENKKNLPNIQKEEENPLNSKKFPVKPIIQITKSAEDHKNKDNNGKGVQKGNLKPFTDSDKINTCKGISSSTQATVTVLQKPIADKTRRRSKSVPAVPSNSNKKDREKLNERRVLFSHHENESSNHKMKKPKNLLLNSKEFEDLKFGKISPSTVVPSVYLYSETYQRKRNEKLKKTEEEDKKKRVFHSKPAPNFRAIHEANFQKKQMEKKLIITAPETPQVLKKSRDNGEKKKKLIEEYEKRIKEQKFVSRPANVIYEEPFQPKKEVFVLETKPFNLHVEKRLEERKKFDMEINKFIETKKKEEDIRRKKDEEECIKKLRKQAVFKAQKNPFK